MRFQSQPQVLSTSPSNTPPQSVSYVNLPSPKGILISFVSYIFHRRELITKNLNYILIYLGFITENTDILIFCSQKTGFMEGKILFPQVLQMFLTF